MRRQDILAASIVCGFCCLSIMVVLSRLIWLQIHGKEKHVEEHITEYAVDGESQPSINGPIATMHTPTPTQTKLASRRKSTVAPVLPSLGALLKAGNDGMYISTLFDKLRAGNNDGLISLDSVYDALAHTLKASPASVRLAYPRAVSQFIASRKTLSKQNRTAAIGQDGILDPPSSRRKNRQSIELVEKAIRIARPKKTQQGQVLVPISTALQLGDNGRSGNAFPGHGGSWEQRHAQYVDGTMGIAVFPEELALLSLLLAAPVHSSSFQGGTEEQESPVTSNNTGAFGISIESFASPNEQHRVSLKRHQLQLSEQLPALSSGHSILFAKHMACGSLPFSRDTHYMYCMLITANMAEAIAAGTPIILQQQVSTDTASAKFLSSVPHSQIPALYQFTPVSNPHSSISSPSLPDHLLNTLALLPYTTLPPLASVPLMTSIRFIASAGLPPGRLLQRLESLIEKIHRQTPDLFLFGPLYERRNAGPLLREQERLGKLGTAASVDDTLAQKTARLHRYGILMERLMALLVEQGIPKDDVKGTVQMATRLELEKSYADALSASRGLPASPPHTPNLNQSRNPEFLTTSAPARMASTRTTTTTPGPSTPPKASSAIRAPSSLSRNSGSTRRSGASALPNLGSQLENILKAPLPLSVQQVAFVARCVLVGWCFTVQSVAWDEGEEGMRFDIPEAGEGAWVLT